MSHQHPSHKEGTPGCAGSQAARPAWPFLPASRCSPVSVPSPGYGSSTSVRPQLRPSGAPRRPSSWGPPPPRPQTGSHPSVYLGLTGLPRRQRASRPPWLRRQARRGAVLTSTHELVPWASSLYLSERGLRRQDGEWNRSHPGGPLKEELARPEGDHLAGPDSHPLCTHTLQGSPGSPPRPTG